MRELSHPPLKTSKQWSYQSKHRRTQMITNGQESRVLIAETLRGITFHLSNKKARHKAQLRSQVSHRCTKADQPYSCQKQTNKSTRLSICVNNRPAPQSTLSSNRTLPPTAFKRSLSKINGTVRITKQVKFTSRRQHLWSALTQLFLSKSLRTSQFRTT